MDLRHYGEDEAALWIESCTDEEFVRVCNVADFVLFFGPTAASGGSMLIAKACAIAAMYIYEGAPRRLNRNRRDLKRALPDRSQWPERRTNDLVMKTLPTYEGVNDDFVKFWAEDPANALNSRDRLRALWKVGTP